MFKIVRKGAHGSDVRPRIRHRADPKGFREHCRRARQPRRFRARKIGYVTARRATGNEVVETRSNGTETTNTARAGDYIVTNLSPQRTPLRDRDGHLDVYVIEPARFAVLYEPAGGEIAQGPTYRAKGLASAIPLLGGFDISAPWGARQTAASGYLLCNATEVYGASCKAFKQRTRW